MAVAVTEPVDLVSPTLLLFSLCIIETVVEGRRKDDYKILFNITVEL